MADVQFNPASSTAGVGANGATSGAAKPPSQALQKDAAALKSDVIGGADSKKTSQDASKLLTDYQSEKGQGGGVNPDKAGTLEDIQNMLEQLMDASGGKSKGGAGKSAGKGAQESFEDVLQQFIGAIKSTNQNGGAQPAQQ